jgi:DNA-binding NarL/FixJ family response regulator
VSERLRVVVVGLSGDDAERLGRRLARIQGIDVLGHDALSAVESRIPRVPSDIDAVVTTPGVLRRVSPAAGDRTERPVEHLTAREHEVLERLADGVGNRQIARELRISEHTVKFHLASIFGKLHASSRTEAVRRALQLGLIHI